MVREILFLSEEERAWLFQWLREDLARWNLEQHPADQLNERMQEARAVLRRVADHLGLGEEERLALTMGEFNAAPESVREGWKAARVAAPHKDSWPEAKRVAFTSGLLPASDAQEWARVRHLPHQGSSGALQLTGVREWLDTSPAKKTMASYNQWRVKENKKHKQQGLLSLVTAQSIVTSWRCSWPDLVQAVSEGNAPPVRDEGGAAEQGQQGQSAPKAPAIDDLRAEPVAAPSDLIADPRLRARRLNVARRALGLNAVQLSERAGIQEQLVGRIETGATDRPGYEKMLALARTLELPLDYFATDDGRKGFPSSAERGAGTKRKKIDPVRRAQRARKPK
ncbi:MAG TPA: helix-turn-helix transcriptional regulator [Solirubrobacterales bacterium]|nr:helix-turn-helix transcriptional regulator [Solirubrobacterales bacterium]